MRIFSLVLLLLTTLLTACSGSSAGTQPSVTHEAEEQQVDQFEHDGHTVTVYFQDPLRQVIASNPEFGDRTPREQAHALNRYLHRNHVYRFEVADPDASPVGQLVLEGDPEVTDSAAFYQVVKYRSGTSGLEEVNRQRVDVRGMLFEHMAPFQTPEGRSAIGNGIDLFEGIFMRVTPYAEVKAAILPYVEQITG